MNQVLQTEFVQLKDRGALGTHTLQRLWPGQWGDRVSQRRYKWRLLQLALSVELPWMQGRPASQWRAGLVWVWFFHWKVAFVLKGFDLI